MEKQLEAKCFRFWQACVLCLSTWRLPAMLASRCCNSLVFRGPHKNSICHWPQRTLEGALHLYGQWGLQAESPKDLSGGGRQNPATSCVGHTVCAASWCWSILGAEQHFDTCFSCWGTCCPESLWEVALAVFRLVTDLRLCLSCLKIESLRLFPAQAANFSTALTVRNYWWKGSPVVCLLYPAEGFNMESTQHHTHLYLWELKHFIHWAVLATVLMQGLSLKANGDLIYQDLC